MGSGSLRGCSGEVMPTGALGASFFVLEHHRYFGWVGRKVTFPKCPSSVPLGQGHCSQTGAERWWLQAVLVGEGKGTGTSACHDPARLQSQGCSLLVPPTELSDDSGSVTYGVVSSVVGNISHTLLDRSCYRGPFLPGFQPIQGAPSATGDGIKITHFDHITYVCPRGGARAALDWYQRCFGFHRFLLNPQERPAEGYVLGGQGVGMLLLALQSAQGTPAHGCKLVFQHGGAGIQHVGLCTTDIVSTTRALQQQGARFFTPPTTYYSQGGKAQEIRGAGQDPDMLAELGILLDTTSPSREYLMQIFTHPIFSEETFFLELIDRRGAPGFGEGNIRALWKAEEQESPELNSSRVLQLAQPREVEGILPGVFPR
uniref:4-hydroxyphenylpyruvate dioxygenase n=1 Tax=Cyanistes caeruleus TaxID=156563 RepID=A0A8C0V361_CYACU